MFFDSCCCTEGKDTDQITFHSATDESVASLATAEGYGPKAGVYVAYNGSVAGAPAVGAAVGVAAGGPGVSNRFCGRQDSIGQQLPMSPMSPMSPGGCSTARSLTAEEKEVEKGRLQTLVNTFAKRAVKGCSCTYFKERSAERTGTKYRIDKSLEYLMIMNASPAEKPEVTCPIATIQDIYSFVEDGESCFPPDVMASLKPEEMELLLMVVYRMGAHRTFRFCLLEDSRESRDIFLECLRILCIYAQSAPTTA